MGPPPLATPSVPIMGFLCSDEETEAQRKEGTSADHYSSEPASLPGLQILE